MSHNFLLSKIPRNQALSVLAISLIFLSFDAKAADEDGAKTLAKRNGCFRCHGIDKDKDGPGWNKIAAKFKVDPNGEEKLLHHLTSGETAKFPDGHEEPHMILKSDSSEETKNLVDWILSLSN